MPIKGDTGKRKSDGAAVVFDGRHWMLADQQQPPQSPSLGQMAGSRIVGPEPIGDPIGYVGRTIAGGASGLVSGAIDKGAQMIQSMFANQYGPLTGTPMEGVDKLPPIAKEALPSGVTTLPGFDTGTSVGRGIATIAPYYYGAAKMGQAEIPAVLQELLPKSAGMIARLATSSLGRAVEGGTADALTANAIGDNPVGAGLTGAVTGGIAGALPTAGNKQLMYGDRNVSLWPTGSRNSEVDRLSKASVLPELTNPDTLVQKESLSKISKFVTTEIRDNMDAGMHSANLAVQKAVKKAEAANNTKFIPLRKMQSDKMLEVSKRFGDRISFGITGDAIDASRELATQLDEAYAAIREAHSATVDSVSLSVSGGKPEQFVVPPETMASLRETAGKILEQFDALAQKGGTREMTGGERGIIDALAKAGDPATPYTLQDLRNINGMLIRANQSKDNFILSKPYMAQLQGAVRDSLRDAIRVAGEKTWGIDGAASFVKIFDESSTKMAKAIGDFDEKVLGSISTAVKNGESEKVVASLLAHPEWADIVIRRVIDSGKSPEFARAAMAKGIWADAVDKATKTGRWDSKAFDQAADFLLQNPRIKDVAFGQHAPMIEEFRNLSRLYDVGPASYVPNSAATGQAGIPFAESAINAQAGQTVASGAMTGSPTAVASGGFSFLFRKLGIENVSEHPDIMAEILTNPSLLNLNNQAMREGLNNLKATGYATISDKAAAVLKRGLYAANPSLFKRLFSSEDAIRRNATALGGALGGQIPY